MAVALRMLSEGKGDAVVSAGSTGALLTGHFLNAENHYHSGIQISIPLDQSYICEILRSLRHFFRILTDAQGHANFY